tara:strand:+ start:987 stop:1244 length:258 start_codon:yes stop_codon:yes gene_type:complete
MKTINKKINKKINPCNYGLITNMGCDNMGYMLIKICGKNTKQQCKYCNHCFEMYRLKPIYIANNQQKLINDIEKAKKDIFIEADE